MRLDREEKEDWAKPLAAMWQSRPYDPQAERDYNKSVGQQMPYCSICLLFHTHYQVTLLSSSLDFTLFLHLVRSTSTIIPIKISQMINRHFNRLVVANRLEVYSLVKENSINILD